MGLETELLLELGEDLGGGGALIGQPAGGESGGIGGGDGGALNDPGIAGEGNEGGAGGDQLDEFAAVGIGGHLALSVAGGDGDDLGVGGGEGGEGGGLVSGGAEGEDAGLTGLLEEVLNQGAGLRATEAEIKDVGSVVEGGGDALGQFEGGGFGAAAIDIDGQHADGLAGVGGWGRGEALEDGFEHGGAVAEAGGGGGFGDGKSGEKELGMLDAGGGEAGIDEGHDDRGLVIPGSDLESEVGEGEAGEGFPDGWGAEGIIGFEGGDIFFSGQGIAGGGGVLGGIEDQAMGFRVVEGTGHPGAQAGGESMDIEGGTVFEADDPFVGQGFGIGGGGGVGGGGGDGDGGAAGGGAEHEEPGGVAFGAGEEGEMDFGQQGGEGFAFRSLVEAGGDTEVEVGFHQDPPAGGGGDVGESGLEGPLLDIGVHAAMLGIPAEVTVGGGGGRG